MTGTIVQKYINALYVVMYDRAADSNGYNYWLSTVTGATSQTPVTDAIAQTMAGSFRAASSTYFNTQYAALSDTNFILRLYENIGGNSAGVTGDALNYWQGRLDSFTGDRAKLAGDFTKAFLEYNGTDADGLVRKAAFENKVAVSQAWVDASSTRSFMNAATTTDAAFQAETRILDGVDSSSASLAIALAQVSAVATNSNLALATGVAVTYGLTTRADTASAAVFTSIPDYTPGGNDFVNTLQDEDTLTGLGANARLDVTLGSINDSSENVIIPTLNNIPTVNVTFAAGGSVPALDLQDAAQTTTVNVLRVGTAGAAVLNMNDEVTSLSVANTVARPDVYLTYVNDELVGDETVGLTLTNVRASDLYVGSEDGRTGSGTPTEQIERLNLTVASASSIDTLNLFSDVSSSSGQHLSITANAALTIGADLDDDGSIIDDNNGLEVGTVAGVNQISVTGAGAVTLGNVGSMTGFTLAGGSATGAITANISNARNDSTASFTTGSGNDTLLVRSSDAATTEDLSGDIATGAGNDAVTVIDSIERTVAITMGTGNDTLTLGDDLEGTVAGGAQVDLGDGDDTVIFGIAANSGQTTEMQEEASIIGGAGNDTVTFTPGDTVDSDGLIEGDSTGSEDGDTLGAAIHLGAGADAVTINLVGTTTADAAGALIQGHIAGGDGIDTLTVSGVKDAEIADSNTTPGGVVGVETLTLVSRAAYDAGRAAAINGLSDEGNDMPNVATANDDDGQSADYSVDLAEFDADLTRINVIHQDGVVLNKAEEETHFTGKAGDAVTHAITNLAGEVIYVESVETTLNDVTQPGADDTAVNDAFGTMYAIGSFGSDVNLDMTRAAAGAQTVVLNDVTASGIQAPGVNNYDVSLNDVGSNITGLTLTVNTNDAHGVNLNNDFDTALTVNGSGTGRVTIDNVDAATITTTAYAGNVFLGVERAVAHVISTGAGNDIVRLGNDTSIALVADNVSLGAGNDVLVLNSTGANGGLTSDDTLNGGDGDDILVIEGAGGVVFDGVTGDFISEGIRLDSTEFLRVTNFEELRLVDQYGVDRYDLELSNDVIDRNGVDNAASGDTGGDLLRVVVDDYANDPSYGGYDYIAVNLDLRELNRFNQIDYTGSDLGNDRLIFSEVSLEGDDILNGGTDDGDTGGYGYDYSWTAAVDGSNDLNAEVDYNGYTYDTIEVRNNAVITIDDLDGVTEFDRLEFVNDQGVQQSLFLTINEDIAARGLHQIVSYGGQNDFWLSTNSDYNRSDSDEASSGSFEVDPVAGARVLLDASAVTTQDLYIDLSMGGRTEDSVVSGDGDDIIIAGEGDDTVYGGAGNDFIEGDNFNGHDNESSSYAALRQTGMDLIYDGAGDDTIRGGRAEDEIHLTAGGNDQLRYWVDVSEASVDDIYESESYNEDYSTWVGDASEGQDTVYGFEFGTDLIRLDIEDFSGTFRHETDTFAGTYVNYLIPGGEGNRFAQNTGLIDLDGNVADDWTGDERRAYSFAITFDSNIDENAFERALVYFVETDQTINFLAGDNNDTIRSNTGADTIDGGDGDDSIAASEGNNDLYGGDGNDLIQAGTGADEVWGGAGNDTIAVGQGDDYIDGGDGVDSIEAGWGSDYIIGGHGADVIDLGSGGGDGNDDVFYAGTEAGGADRIRYFNATGTDELVFDDNVSGIVFTEGDGAGSNTIDGADGLTAANYEEAATFSTLDDDTIVFNFTTDIGAYDFSSLTDVAILSLVEDALENNAAAGGLLSGVAGVQVEAADANTNVLLLINDGSNVAVVRYQEGAAKEADFGGELSLLAVLIGTNAAGLSEDNFFG